MASISTTIRLTDKMTNPLLSITKALNSTIDAFEDMENSMNGSFDTSKINAAKSSIESANSAIIDLGNDIDNNRSKQEKFNDSINDGKIAVDGLVKGFLGLKAIQKVKSWIEESLDLANTQRNVENQLKVVLANMGSGEKEYENIVKKASQIQGKTIFGDEAMIGGAAELSTYIKDTNAIMSMMDTLSNYASGMSGGAEVNTQQMIEYATQLGKVLNGTYDGITKKGFELSDAQKKIIENGSDMEKALVVNDVINESWNKLAENMAKTPQGMLTQTNNELGDLKETLGNSIIPYFATLNQIFVDMIGPAIQWIADNMNWLAPIILIVAGAFGIFTIGLIAYKIVAWATAAANWAMVAPLLIVVGIILAIVGVIVLAVKIFNKWTGATASATGVIMGLIYTLAAYIYNTFIVPVWNYIAMFINFFANVFNDPIASIKILFLDMAVSVIGYVENMLKAIEKLINKIPGVKVNITSGISSFKNDLEDKIKEIKDESGYKEVASKLDYWDYGDAFNSGYQKGVEIEDNLNSMLDGNNIFDSMKNGINDIASDTGNISDSLDVTDEDLKYLRDLAEQEAINRFTTAEIHVDMTNNNNISNDTDLDGLINNLVEGVTIAMEETARGV